MKIKKNKILYIAGYGRSGSTLIDLVLSAHDDAIGVGELSNLEVYAEQLQKGQDDVSKFWQGILALYSFERINQVKSQSVFAPFSAKYQKQQATNYRKIVDGIFKTSGKNILVDSSKTAWACFFRPYFLKLCGYDVFILHVKRDGYDVYQSMKKLDNVKAEKNLKDTKLGFPLLRAFIGWHLANFSAKLNAKLCKGGYYLLNYENFVNNPEEEVYQIFNKLGVDEASVVEKIRSHEGFNSTYHFSGNRMRKEKNIEIKPAKPKHAKRTLSRVLFW